MEHIKVFHTLPVEEYITDLLAVYNSAVRPGGHPVSFGTLYPQTQTGKRQYNRVRRIIHELMVDGIITCEGHNSTARYKWVGPAPDVDMLQRAIDNAVARQYASQERHDKRKHSQPETPAPKPADLVWKKQTGDFIDLGGPELIEYDLPAKDIPVDLLRAAGFDPSRAYKIIVHDHKLIFNGYEILFSDLWNKIPKK